MMRLKRIAAAFISVMAIVLLFSSLGMADDIELKRSKDYEHIKAKVVRKIPLPQGYHEGLYFDGSAMWVLNGNGIKTWVIDVASGQVAFVVPSIASFSEGMTAMVGGKYFLTDWNEKKLYKTEFDGKKFTVEAGKSLSPGLPAGVVWTGSRLFVITWRRGLGTKYSLLELDKDMNIVERIGIQKIEEPAHMTWDGANLWITSWYNQRVYKIDVNSWEIVGVLRSPVPRATGIAWDGKYLWLTGTRSDLYQLEVI